MKFMTTLNGQPCYCNVTWYSAERPMVITGSGFGDAEPPEPEEFEYSIEYPEGVGNIELAAEVTEADHWRLLAEYKAHKADILAR